jgi:uncharacterized protein
VTIPPEQQEVALYLAELAGHEAKETHISAVFVGSDTVWKLKKAVRLPFLDFSTLQAREHFLRRELAINQPAAPGLYRDIASISRRSDGMLTLGGEPALDWVLRMARIPEGDFLDAIAARGELSPSLLDGLGDAVARDQALREPVAGWDSAASLLRVTAGNAQSALAAGLPAAPVATWQQRTEAALHALRPWLTRRAASGFVRRCHGDLHLGNLCLWQGKPVAFDALEFDEAMATIDTGYDLAFLLMDLEHRVSRSAANRVMNRTLARSGDVEMAPALPAFMSERAMVKAHISAAMGNPTDAATYLEAAQAYLAPPPPLMLAIGGLQGTGKSTLARRLAPDLGRAPGAVVLRSDELRKRLFDRAPEECLPQEAYSETANQKVNATLVDLARTAAEGGHAVILDATFLDPSMRQAAEAAARKVGVPFLGVWLQAPLAELERRIESRRNDASDATLAVLRRSAQSETLPADWLRVDAQDLDMAANVVRGALL